MTEDNGRSYASGPEILAYLTKAANDQGLNDCIKFRHRVTSAQWDDDHGIWQLQIQNEQTGTSIQDWCHVLVNGTGFLK